MCSAKKGGRCVWVHGKAMGLTNEVILKGKKTPKQASFLMADLIQACIMTFNKLFFRILNLHFGYHFPVLRCAQSQQAMAGLYWLCLGFT